MIVIGLILGGFVFYFKQQADVAADIVLSETGSCIVPETGCLHSANNNLLLFGIVLSVLLFGLGVYLIFFDKTQEKLAQQQKDVSKALEEAKKQDRIKDEFSAYLAGFSIDEQKILKSVHAQEGIKQSTLKFRADMSKTTLSLILKSLEDRKIIMRKPSGKTNQVFLVKKF